MGIDWIELSEYALAAMGEPPAGGRYALRPKKPKDAAKRRQIERIAYCGDGAGCRQVAEIEISGMRAFRSRIRCLPSLDVRVCGLGDVMTGNYQEAFREVREAFRATAALCPTNESGCATAAAVEWIASGGEHVVTSFGGIGGFAATEEVALFLSVSRMRRAGKNYSNMPDMRHEAEKMAGRRFPLSKPVIGERIFAVEAGVHVDGILKQPKCYEPYPPERVGQLRSIALGRLSGTASVRAKLAERSLSASPSQIAALLEQVKGISIAASRAITDEEFFDLASGAL
jgi:homocitrate synthase NifV